MKAFSEERSELGRVASERVATLTLSLRKGGAFLPFPLLSAAWILCFIPLIQQLPFPVHRFRVLLIPSPVLTVGHHRANAFEEERKPSLVLQGANLYGSLWVRQSSVSLFLCGSAPEIML